MIIVTWSLVADVRALPRLRARLQTSTRAELTLIIAELTWIFLN